MKTQSTSLPAVVIRLLQRAGKDRIARRVALLDIHDDNLVSVRIWPPHTQKNSATIEFELEDDGTGKLKTLTFLGCANLRFVMDFDVLAEMFFAQTYGASCSAEIARMRRLVRSQKKHWRTEFMPPLLPATPIRKKIATIRRYHLFTVKFFGGTVDILARDFKIKISKDE